MRALLVATLLTFPTKTAYAYRPFDTTDASVAHRGEVEVELGPVGFLRTSSVPYLVAPSVVVNVGLSSCLELVLEGRGLFSLEKGPGETRASLVDSGVFAKGVLREGSLQDGTGPSVAVEAGALLPTVRGEPGWGAGGVTLVSQRGSVGTVHLGAGVFRSRAAQFEGLVGLIVEGPYAFTVRPVGELVVRRSGETRGISGLVGAILRVRDTLSFDAAFRLARTADVREFEMRLGLTFAIQAWGAR